MCAGLHLMPATEDNLKKLLISLCLAFTAGCATDLAGDPADLGRLDFPTGVAIHPNGKYAYIVGSNFDLDYRSTDGGGIYVLDLENNKILDTSKRMGSFGTNIVLSQDARHGYTVTRDDDALVWFEISEDGSNIFCPKAKSSSNSLLSCRVIVDGDPTHLAITHSYRETSQIDESGNATTQKVEFDLIMIAHLRDAGVTAVTVREGENGKPRFSRETAAMVRVASEVLWFEGEKFIVTGRAASNLMVVSPAIDKSGKVKGLYANESISVPNAFGAYQGRGMTMDPTRQNLYLINQYPNSLLKFDITGIARGDLGSDRTQVTSMTMLPSDMSKIAWVGDDDTGMLYLTAVDKNAIYIVDPRKMEIERIFSVGKGPYELVPIGSTLYVLHFNEATLWALDTTDPKDPVVKAKYLEKTEAVQETSDPAQETSDPAQETPDPVQETPDSDQKTPED